MNAFLVLFGVLSLAVFVWFFLCYRLVRILEQRHPEKYEAMGRPGLIRRFSVSGGIGVMKFLFGREWRERGDAGLAALGRTMLVFSVTWSAGFLLLFLASPFGVLR